MQYYIIMRVGRGYTVSRRQHRKPVSVYSVQVTIATQTYLNPVIILNVFLASDSVFGWNSSFLKYCYTRFAETRNRRARRRLKHHALYYYYQLQCTITWSSDSWTIRLIPIQLKLALRCTDRLLIV